MRRSLLWLFLGVFAYTSGSANAALMAIWDFGPASTEYTEQPQFEQVLGIPTLVLAGGEKDDNGKDGVEYTDAAGVLHEAGQGGAWEDIKVSGLDAEWILTIDTTGWTGMAIRWDYKSKESPSFDFDYRVGGEGDWVDIFNNEPITADNEWYSITVDLSAITAIENQPIVEFYMYDLDEQGNDKFVFDNLELTGVPEPVTLVLLAIGGLAIRRRHAGG